jgi:hypothetical protein
MPTTIIGGPDSGLNPADARPDLVVVNAAEAYEWLREAIGRNHPGDRLTDLHYRMSGLRQTCDGARALTPNTLAALIQARYRVVKRNGTPTLFPVAACRLVLDNLLTCPHLIYGHTGNLLRDERVSA